MWAIRFWLDGRQRLRDRALFDLAIDSKLRGCDVVKVRIDDLVSAGRIRTPATVVRRKTGRPVQLELLEPVRTSMLAWLDRPGGTLDDYVFPSRTDPFLSTRQYARLVAEWVTGIGLHRKDYGTHSLAGGGLLSTAVVTRQRRIRVGLQTCNSNLETTTMTDDKIALRALPLSARAR